MILFHDVVEIRALPDRDGRLVNLIGVFNRCRVAPTLVDCHLLREPRIPNRLMSEGRQRQDEQYWSSADVPQAGWERYR